MLNFSEMDLFAAMGVFMKCNEGSDNFLLHSEVHLDCSAQLGLWIFMYLLFLLAGSSESSSKIVCVLKVGGKLFLNSPIFFGVRCY